MNEYLVNWMHHPSGKQGTTKHKAESYMELCRKLAEWNASNPSAWQYWFIPGLNGLGVAVQANPIVKRIQDALGTAETGEDLVEVARNAHKAEQDLAGRSAFPLNEGEL